ncbi:HlyIII-domain-containing protein [Wilcoxina mikolae CBS 423.85]|nr:HlyIII-domain-containing protein [Wilcoxina mikolae CBS 423.85]
MYTRPRRTRLESTPDKPTQAAKKIERKIEHALTVMWDDLPSWQQDNEFIIYGYRPASGSFKKSAKSLFYFHNESINIYSHLIGGIVFLLTGFYLHHTLSIRYSTATIADLYAFASFLLGAAACFSLSAVCHLISNHSLSGASFGSQLDYLGIVVFILGTVMASVYYGFRCDEKLMYMYWSMMLIVGLFCATTAMNPSFNTPRWRPIRGCVFVGLGLFSVIPLLHGTFRYGFTVLEERMGLRWSIIQGVLYLVGTAVFALRVPERWRPGKYDLVGASHQIMHFFALAAAVAQLKALVTAFDFLHGKTGGGVC